MHELSRIFVWTHDSIQVSLLKCRSQAFLSELNKRDSAAVIKHVDSGSMAVNSAMIVEYLKALVKTDKIAQYGEGGVVR